VCFYLQIFLRYGGCPKILKGHVTRFDPLLPNFHRAASNAGWSSQEKAVCLYGRLSVHPSVCQTRALWQNGRKIVQIFILYERSFSLVFWEEEWLVGSDPVYLKFWVNRLLLEWNRRFWTDIRSYRLSLTPSMKSSVNTNMIMCFPMSLRWSSYVALSPALGAEKCKTAVFGVKLDFVWRKSATKFLCVKTVSDKVVRHSLVYAKMSDGWHPLLAEISGQPDRVGAKSLIFDLFSPTASQP